MKLLTLINVTKGANLEADVYIKVGDKIYKTQEVILSSVDPTIQGFNSVTIVVKYNE